MENPNVVPPFAARISAIPLAPAQPRYIDAAPTSERMVALDALRGLAVLGIFWVNVVLFALPDAATTNPLAAGGGGIVNHGLWAFGYVFVEGTMRGLFSLMFGAGVVLLTVRADGADTPVRVADIYFRRTLWLFAFGLVHGYLLMMPNDILMFYGLAGLILFSLRNLSPRTLAALSAILLVLTTASFVWNSIGHEELREHVAEIQARADAGQELTPAEADAVREWEEARAETWPTQADLQWQIDMRDKPLSELFVYNAEIINENTNTGDLIASLIDAWLMMFLGMALLKWRVITAERSVRFYLGLMLAGYCIGLPPNIWMAWISWQSGFDPSVWYPFAASEISRVAVALGHIGLFFLAWRCGALAWLMRALAAVGRMALTNYISQTVIANVVFTGIGFGLFGVFDRAGVHLFMAAVWAFQIAFSLWWLSRFRFGPLEWAWRSLTYMQRQPMRLDANAPTNTV